VRQERNTYSELFDGSNEMSTGHNMNRHKYKLAALTSHPIQSQVPLFRMLSEHPEVDLTVYFCDSFGADQKTYDPGFGMEIKWDIPLLEGYKYKILKNYSLRPSSGFWGLNNPGIINELLTNRYDAIWMHGYANLSSWFCFLGAWLTNAPIMMRGESHLMNYRPGWKRMLKKVFLPVLFDRIACFLTIGTLNAEYYKHYGVSERKMFLTPYTVNNEFFSEEYKKLKNKRSELKEMNGIAPECPVILYAAKMMPRKKAMDLLKAYELMRNKTRAALVFVGDGGEKGNLELYAREHKLEDIYFVGFKNHTELPEFFSIADVFVLPSTDEPWGMVINDAMNFGLPVVTTDQVGAAPDLVKHGENGFIYPVGDIDKLAGYLSRLIHDDDLREKMGKRSLEIISKWGLDEDCDGIVSALKYVCGRSQSGERIE
jgi:glycosyltransferase involved in cell wall biosynthesis